MPSDADNYEQDLWGPNRIEGRHQDQRIGETIAMLPRSVETLADVGAGDGALVNDLATTKKLRVFGVERSARAVAHIKVPALRASIDALPLANRSVDCVTACEVLEHLPVDVYDAARAELARVASRWILITVPNREDRRRGRVTCSVCDCRYNRFRHLRSFDEQTMATLIPGFEVHDVRQLGPHGVYYPWFLSVAAERLGAVRRPGSPLCPQCGWSDPGAPLVDEPRTAAARRWMPRSRRRLWLAALYERAT